jgi:hypothetical protein
MQRLLDRGPFALRDHDDALGFAARDRDRRLVGNHPVHHRLEIGAGIREAEGFHESSCTRNGASFHRNFHLGHAMEMCMAQPDDDRATQFVTARDVMKRRKEALRQLAIAEKIMREDRDMLRELSK